MEHSPLPPTRHGLTRKFKCGLDVYLTVNLKSDGNPGEVFVKLGKQGSTMSGLMQAWAVTISAALQRGVPWNELHEKYLETTFPPRTDKYSSIVDAVARNVHEMIEELQKQHRTKQGQKTLDFEKENE